MITFKKVFQRSILMCIKICYTKPIEYRFFNVLIYVNNVVFLLLSCFSFALLYNKKGY